jgi:uncharacterized RDD family membrane protein YckC
MSINTSFNTPGSQTVQVVGFGRRLVAYLIDTILLSIVGLCLGFGAGVIAVGMASVEGSNDTVVAFDLCVRCLGFLINGVYFVAFWATTGQTLGKMVMGIKVISLDGSPVSWGKALLRYVGYIVSSLALLIGFIWAAFDQRRQGWHDKIAGTYVVPKDTQFSAMDNVTFVPSDSSSTGIIIAILVSVIPILILVSIVVIAILLLLGPVVGNVFSNIVENLQTPTP